jgi:hypothetical protein
VEPFFSGAFEVSIVMRVSGIFTEGRRQMLRKTLFTLVSVAALGLGSAAMAAHGGGGGKGGGGGERWRHAQDDLF